MGRDNANLGYLFANTSISKANKAKRFSRAIKTCKAQIKSVENKIAALEETNRELRKREAIASKYLAQLETRKPQSRRQIPTKPGQSTTALFDREVVRTKFGDLEILEGRAISLAKFTQRTRGSDGRVWISPIAAAQEGAPASVGPLAKPVDLGSSHAARALQRPGYMHALILVKTQLTDPKILDGIEEQCAKRRTGRLPLADTYVNMTFDGEVAQRLLDPQTRDSELAWMKSATETDGEQD